VSTCCIAPFRTACSRTLLGQAFRDASISFSQYGGKIIFCSRADSADDLPRSPSLLQTHYIIEQARRQQYFPRPRASDQELLFHASTAINAIYFLSSWCEHPCRLLWSLVHDEETGFWNQAIPSAHRLFVRNIIGIAYHMLSNVAATGLIEPAFYSLWIVRSRSSSAAA